MPDPIDAVTTAAGNVHVFTSTPASPGPHPGVVVLHDLNGMREDTRRHCRRFAEAGYVAMAPDMGWSVGCVVRNLAHMANGTAPPAVEATRQHLLDHPAVDPSRIGFCMASHSLRRRDALSEILGDRPHHSEGLRSAATASRPLNNTPKRGVSRS